MGVLTPKRAVLFVVAVVLGANAFAGNPSPRTQARMAWDTPNNVGVLFGGLGPFDGATTLQHDSAETWLWNGSRWLQRFPQTIPPSRAVHSMVFDTTRNRVVMFGGRKAPADSDGQATYLNDTWVYDGENWTQIESAEVPPVRQFGVMTYDRVRDRVILYGGNVLAADEESFDTRFDTWEFDGQQWTPVISGTVGPKVARPEIAYDATLNQTFLIGLNEAATAIVMYRYDAAAKAWVAVTPTALPACVNEGHLLYRERTGKLMFFGGICVANTPATEDVWEWDNAGNKWTKLTTSSFPRLAGQAVSYDPLRNEVIAFGGTAALGTVVASQTNILRGTQWRQAFLDLRPNPRSLARFDTDTASNTVWLFGGLDETSTSYYTDLWGYRNGQWFFSTGAPGLCDGPLSAFDSDRSRLVVTCPSTETYEWTGTEWKTFTDLKPEPQARQFAGMVYDPKLKKTILFGGYNGSDFRNDTWTWNGTAWAEVKVDKDARPPHRAQMAMWYDPLQQKVVLYGGIGRGSVNERVTRYSDMWAFNGTAWTKIDVVTPGIRFGPQVAVNPVTGKTLLFGGLKAEPVSTDPANESIRQFFTNDTWEWNGANTTWTHIETDPTTPEPDVRENGSMAWDPAGARLVLFAGYADGFYRSDVWEWNGTDWIPRVEAGARRRAVR
jgi:N-acetylneuraminic acid mutarotase